MTHDIEKQLAAIRKVLTTAHQSKVRGEMINGQWADIHPDSFDYILNRGMQSALNNAAGSKGDVPAARAKLAAFQSGETIIRRETRFDRADRIHGAGALAVIKAQFAYLIANADDGEAKDSLTEQRKALNALSPNDQLAYALEKFPTGNSKAFTGKALKVYTEAADKARKALDKESPELEDMGVDVTT